VAGKKRGNFSPEFKEEAAKMVVETSPVYRRGCAYIPTWEGWLYLAILWNAPPSQSTESMFGGNLRW
jgi:hypothetical protein